MAGDAGREDGSRWRSPLVVAGLVIAAVLVLVVLAALASSLVTSDDQIPIVDTTSGADDLLVDLTLYRVDIEAGRAEAVVTMVLPSDQLTEDGLPRASYRVVVSDVFGSQRLDITAGEPFAPLDVSLRTIGSTRSYPFDRHEVFVSVRVVDDQGRPVPASLFLELTTDGWDGAIAEREEVDAAEVAFDLELRRTAPLRTWAVLAFGLLIVIAVSTVTITVVTWRSRRAVAATLFGFFAGVLFAVPSIRNALPGAPPIGVRADYISFFIAVFLAVAALVGMVVTWVVRGTEPPARRR